jgi:hypothetical protein
MKFTKNDDGTVTVLIPKSDEVYDPETGALFVAETLTAEDFKAIVKGKPTEEPS